jgi:hypothetical protein
MNQTNPSTSPQVTSSTGFSTKMITNSKTIKDLSKPGNFCHLWAQDEKLNTKETTQNAKLIIALIFTIFSKDMGWLKEYF